LDAAFEKVLTDWKAAGFAVAVVEKNKIIYSKGFGYRDLEKKLPVTPNTLFAIGSCTKAFTSSLIGLLQKEGKVEFDKPAHTYLNTLRFYNDEMNNGITLRDMMSHRTGLPRHDYSWYYFSTSSRDSIMQRIQYQQPTFPVRNKWQYNNFMFWRRAALLKGLPAKHGKKTFVKNSLPAPHGGFQLFCFGSAKKRRRFFRLWPKTGFNY
jgi:CubicO group peptidase (beta-lactamase class C family)